MENRVYFTKDNIEQKILAKLKVAKVSIKVAVAWFKNPVLFNFLLEKQQKGVLIEIIMTDDSQNFRNPNLDFQKLVDVGANVYVYRNTLMHHKFCIIDERYTITGSYNWTVRAEQNVENILWSNDLDICKPFNEEFERLKENAEQLFDIATTEFKIVKNNAEDNECDDDDTTYNVDDKNDDYGVDDKNEEYDDKNDDDIDEYGEGDNYYYENALADAQISYNNKDYDEALRLCDIIYNLYIKTTNVSSLFLLMAEIYWRKSGVAKKQRDIAKKEEYANKAIKYSNDAINANNLNYSAYNTRANVLSEQGKDTAAIRDYNHCINNKPNDYVYYYNKGLAEWALSNVAHEEFPIPHAQRVKFEKDARSNFRKTIECADKVENTLVSYHLLNCRGKAKLLLDSVEARKDYEAALLDYNKTDKDEQDKHILEEIKRGLKDVQKLEAKGPVISHLK